jgi:DNA-binding response OmpR family regulator
MKILVIEDERNLAAALKRGLQAEGASVDLAHTGTDGLWMAEENPYDVLVVDIMLPGINGFQICERLRGQGDWTPILMLTAKDGELDETEALDAGADDYLTKPFSYLVLQARLRALLRRGARERPATLAAGDLTVDPASRRCRRGQQEIALTAREFSVLEYLMRRVGEVVTKRNVLDNVWDYDFEGDPNIVEVYIRYLRNKIDRPFGRSTIETVRGSGYRIAADG